MFMVVSSNFTQTWSEKPTRGEGDRGDVISFYYEYIYIFSDSLSWKAVIVLHSPVHMKSDRNTCVMNEKGEREREVQTPAPSHCTADQSLHEVRVNVGPAHAPNQPSERCETSGFSSYLATQQACLKAYTCLFFFHFINYLQGTNNKTFRKN